MSKPNYKEFLRRGETQKQSSKQQSKDVNIFDETQQIAAVTLINRFQRPSKEFPAFRFLGFFQDIHKLKTHYQTKLAHIMPNCNIHGAPRGKWILIAKNTQRQNNAEYVKNKIENVKKAYYEHSKKEASNFKKIKETKEHGSTGYSTHSKISKIRKSTRIRALKKHAKKLPKLELKEIPRDAEIRHQDFVVVSVIPDLTTEVLHGQDDPEPIIAFWRAFGDKQEAKEWIESSASNVIRSVHLDLFDSYEIIRPTNDSTVLEQIEESWRNSEQHNIMSHKKYESKRVQEFRDYCESQGVDAPLIDASGVNVSSSAPDPTVQFEERETTIEVTPDKSNETDADMFQDSGWKRTEEIDTKLVTESADPKDIHVVDDDLESILDMLGKN